MSGLKQALGLAQGVGLLSTALSGTGVFAVPVLAALVAGNNSLWAWPVLIALCIYGLNINLDALIVYANGIFIMIYLLCMLAGLWVFLPKRSTL